MTVIIPFPPDESGGDGLVVTPEMLVQRRLTDAFIMTQPVTITLIRRERVRRSSGAWVLEDQEPRPAQVLRLVEPGSDIRPVQTIDGVQREIEFEILGAWNSHIGVHDRFTLDDDEWEVFSLYHFNGWERRAQVIRRGTH